MTFRYFKAFLLHSPNKNERSMKEGAKHLPSDTTTQSYIATIKFYKIIFPKLQCKAKLETDEFSANLTERAKDWKLAEKLLANIDKENMGFWQSSYSTKHADGRQETRFETS
ncbi:hypothetical protein GQX74_005284 [Glossina fuscipes]|nr:hypothetical protein GQX74_005284 [Glossina fuscipes]